MKKAFFVALIVLVSAFSLFFHEGLIYAATPTPTPLPTINITPIAPPKIINKGFETMFGIGCGNAFDPKANKCCPTDPSITNLALQGFGAPFDWLTGFINGLIGGIIGPVFEGIGNAFGGSLVPCSTGIPSTPNDVKSAKCICLDASNLSRSIGKLCDKLSNTSEIPTCTACMAGGGVWTGMGCIQANVQKFIQETLLGMGIGIAGGVALLCIMLAAFQMQTSSGNAEKVKKAQELLTNCITGLMVIIFSVLILKIIGVDILKIPGFGN